MTIDHTIEQPPVTMSLADIIAKDKQDGLIKNDAEEKNEPLVTVEPQPTGFFSWLIEKAKEFMEGRMEVIEENATYKARHQFIKQNPEMMKEYLQNIGVEPDIELGEYSKSQALQAVAELQGVQQIDFNDVSPHSGQTALGNSRSRGGKG